MPTTYPLDLTGVSSSNLIYNELHSVSESHYKDYFFLVPNFAPFFIDNFIARVTIGNVTRDLVEDVDYSFGLSYVAGTRSTGKTMYGAITLHNLDMNGIVSITYQTVGGTHVVDRLGILTYLVDKAYNPRVTTWDLITNAPEAFPPTPHYQDYDSFYGQEELVNMLGQIRDSIVTNSSLTQTQITEFMTLLNTGGMGNTLSLDGGTMVGPIFLRTNIVETNEAVPKSYVDSINASLNGRIDEINVSTGTINQITIDYVKGMIDQSNLYALCFAR